MSRQLQLGVTIFCMYLALTFTYKYPPFDKTFTNRDYWVWPLLGNWTPCTARFLSLKGHEFFWCFNFSKSFISGLKRTSVKSLTNLCYWQELNIFNKSSCVYRVGGFYFVLLCVFKTIDWFWKTSIVLLPVRSQNDLMVPRKLIDVKNTSISTENRISKSLLSISPPPSLLSFAVNCVRMTLGDSDWCTWPSTSRSTSDDAVEQHLTI